MIKKIEFVPYPERLERKKTRQMIIFDNLETARGTILDRINAKKDEIKNCWSDKRLGELKDQLSRLQKREAALNEKSQQALLKFESIGKHISNDDPDFREKIEERIEYFNSGKSNLFPARAVIEVARYKARLEEYDWRMSLDDIDEDHGWFQFSRNKEFNRLYFVFDERHAAVDQIMRQFRFRWKSVQGIYSRKITKIGMIEATNAIFELEKIKKGKADGDRDVQV